MSYELIDKTITDWAARHAMQVLTRYQDTEVRTMFLQGEGRERGQIWVDPPTADGLVGVHAAVYRKRGRDNERVDLSVDRKDLEGALEQAYARVTGWLGVAS